MKRLVFFVCSFLAILETYAQEQPKSMFITADIGGVENKDEKGNKYTTGQFSVALSTLNAKNWSIGVFAEYGRGYSQTEKTANYSQYKSYESYRLKNNSFYFGSQARYYYPLNASVFLFGETQAGLKFETLESRTYVTSFRLNTDQTKEKIAEQASANKREAILIKGIISPGIVYFPSPNFGIELKSSLIEYNHILDDSSSPKGQKHPHDLNTILKLSNLRFGASFYL